MLPGKPKMLKRNNRKIIIDLLRQSSELTVADISRTVGLSKTTVMKILDFLTRKNIIVTAGKGVSTGEGGKKPELYRFNARCGYALALHISPNAVCGAITDLSLRILAAHQIINREDESIDVVISEMVELAERMISELGIGKQAIVGTAIGAHGITNFHKGLIYTAPHFPSWGDNVPMKKLVSEALVLNAPIYVDNQIRFQVLGEKSLGVARQKKNIIVLEGGEGLVAGIIVKNEIKRGVHYLAGEVGHMIINPDEDTVCSCGGRGCFEMMVSTKRVLASAQERRANYPDSIIYSGSGSSETTIEDVFDAANSGDELARVLVDETIKWFTIGISNMILMYDPEVVVIQGLYAKAGPYFLENLRKGVNTCSLVRIEKDVEIQYSLLGEDRGVLGGAAFVVAEYFDHAEFYET